MNPAKVTAGEGERNLSTSTMTSERIPNPLTDEICMKVAKKLAELPKELESERQQRVSEKGVLARFFLPSHTAWDGLVTPDTFQTHLPEVAPEHLAVALKRLDEAGIITSKTHWFERRGGEGIPSCQIVELTQLGRHLLANKTQPEDLPKLEN